MPIRVNNSDSFPGAQSLFVPPVTKADCCLFSTVQAMMDHAAAEGWPHTVKGGRCMVDASLAEIRGVCFIGEPTITSTQPDPLSEDETWHVYDSYFGTVEGEVWLGSGNTWSSSATKVRQSVTAWVSGHISLAAPVMDGLPFLPWHVYIYVINDCGERNAVGFETEVVETPP